MTYSRTTKCNLTESSVENVVNHEREIAWKKIGVTEEFIVELKQRLTADRHSSNISISTTDTLIILSSLCIVLGELGWRKHGKDSIEHQTVS